MEGRVGTFQWFYSIASQEYYWITDYASPKCICILNFVNDFFMYITNLFFFTEIIQL